MSLEYRPPGRAQMVAAWVLVVAAAAAAAAAAAVVVVAVAVARFRGEGRVWGADRISDG